MNITSVRHYPDHSRIFSSHFFRNGLHLQQSTHLSNVNDRRQRRVKYGSAAVSHQLAERA